MANAWTTQRSGNWSRTSDNADSPWYDNGAQTALATIPQDGDGTITIAAAHNVCFDVDQSAWVTGLANVVITGGATPGMLYAKYDAAATNIMVIKTACTLSGTTSTNRGRLLANSDGVWANSTALPVDRMFYISLLGTASINAADLDIKLCCAQPTYRTVATYGTKVTVASVSAAADTLTITGMGAPFTTDGTAVMLQSSGALPSPLVANRIYYTRDRSGDTLKLERSPSTGAIDITDAGSGTIEIYSGMAASQTVLNVLTDVTGDATWQGGAGTWANTNVLNAVVLESPDSTGFATNYDIQRTTIAAGGIAAGAITLNNATDSAQKPGALLCLMSRNIAIRTNTTTTATILVNWGSSTFTGSVLNCSFRNTAVAATGMTTYGYGAEAGVSHTFTGASFGGLNRAISNGTTHMLSNCTLAGNNSGVYYGSGYTLTTCTLAGNNTGVSYGSGHMLSNCTLAGNNYGVSYGSGYTLTTCTLAGNNYGVYSGSGHTLTTCTLAGNNYGVIYGSGFTLSNCTLAGNNYGVSYGSGFTLSNCTGSNATEIYRVPRMTLYNTVLGSTENSGYNTNYCLPWSYVDSFHHDGVSGAFKCWSRGGIAVNDDATYPTGYTKSFKHTCADATMWNFRQQEIKIQPGHGIRVWGWIKQGAVDMSAAPPKIEIVHAFADPLVDGVSSPLAACNIPVSNGSVTDWQAVSCMYANTTSLAMVVYIRESAKYASGDVYFVVNEAIPVGAAGANLNGVLQ